MSHGPSTVEWARGVAENPLRPTEAFDPSEVGDAKLQADVTALLFSDARDPTTWEHLGDLNPAMQQAPSRHVTIDPTPTIVDDNVEFVQLPLGLGLLFDVATSEEFENPHRRLTGDALAYIDRVAAASRGGSQHGGSERRSRSPQHTAVDDASEAGVASLRSGKSLGHRSLVSAKPEAAASPTPADDAKSTKSAGKAATPGPAGSEARDSEGGSNEPIDADEATERIRLEGPPNCLIYLLTIAASRPGLDDHCVRLYEEGMARLARIRAADAERARKLREAEDKECTFRPNIGEASKKQGRGKDFFTSTIDWQKQQARKLAKKVEAEQKSWDEDTLVPWKMNEHSRALVDARRRATMRGGVARSGSAATGAASSKASPHGSQQTTPERSQSRGTSHAQGGDDSMFAAPLVHSSRAFDKEFFEAAFTPVTNARVGRIMASVASPSATKAKGASSKRRSASRPDPAATKAEADESGAPSPVPMASLQEAADGEDHRDGSADQEQRSIPPREGDGAAEEAEDRQSQDARSHHTDRGSAAAATEPPHEAELPDEADDFEDADEDDDRIVILDYDGAIIGPNSSVVDERPVVERMDEDIKGRRDRIEKRKDIYRRRMRARLFDPATGQPLFEPNAMPAFLRHGERVDLEGLTPAEKKDFYAQVRKQHNIDLETAVRIAKRRTEARTGKEPRSMEAIVQNLLQKQQQSDSKIAKKKRREEAEIDKQFKPTVNLGPARPGHVPVHQRPLPTRKVDPTEGQRNFVHTSEKATARVYHRSTDFMAARERRLAKVADSREREELAECTGRPSINPVSTILVRQSHRRTAEEVDFFEQQQEEERRSKSHVVFDAAESLQRESRQQGLRKEPQQSRPRPSTSGSERRPRVTVGESRRPRLQSTSVATADEEAHAAATHAGFDDRVRSPVHAVDVEALVDELVSVGRRRAPANEPTIPRGVQAAADAADEARRQRDARHEHDPDLMRILEPRYNTAASSAAPPAYASSWRTSSYADPRDTRGVSHASLDTEAEALQAITMGITSPNPTDPSRRAPYDRIPPPPPVSAHPIPSYLDDEDDEDAAQRRASQSVDDVLNQWRRLDDLSGRLLSVDSI